MRPVGTLEAVHPVSPLASASVLHSNDRRAENLIKTLGQPTEPLSSVIAYTEQRRQIESAEPVHPITHLSSSRVEDPSPPIASLQALQISHPAPASQGITASCTPSSAGNVQRGITVSAYYYNNQNCQYHINRSQ